MDLATIASIHAGGVGSGCHGDNCGRPSGAATATAPEKEKFATTRTYADPNVEMVPTWRLQKYAEFNRLTEPETVLRPANYLKEMISDIREKGLNSKAFDKPMVMTYNPETGKALLTDGNHRLPASRLAGLHSVPVKGSVEAAPLVGDKGHDVSFKNRVEPKGDFKVSSMYFGGPGSGRHKTFYHGTTPESAMKIMKEGLKPRDASKFGGIKLKAAFLHEDHEHALDYGKENDKGEIAVIHFKVPVERIGGAEKVGEGYKDKPSRSTDDFRNMDHGHLVSTKSGFKADSIQKVEVFDKKGNLDRTYKPGSSVPIMNKDKPSTRASEKDDKIFAPLSPSFRKWLKNRDMSAGGPGSGCRGDQCGRPKGSGKDEDRAARAKAAYVPTKRSEKLYSEAQEKALAAHLGGQHLGGNKPFDVVLPGKALIELKVKIPGKFGHETITIHPDSRAKKEKMERKLKLKAYVVCFDDRRGANNRTIYWCKGYCYRFKSMNVAKDLDDLKAKIFGGKK